MERMATVLHGLAQERGEELPFRATTDLDDAVEGADFVFSAIRVGRLEGRVVDESVPLSIGVLGQETTGPGGICFALRTIPAMVHLAETIARRAPASVADQLHQPRRHGHRGRAAGARRPRGRHLRLALRPLPPRRPRARPAPRADVVRLLRPQPPRLAQGRPRRRARPPPGAAGRRREARRLRGGPPVRRRLAARARDDPERVPLLLLRGRGGAHGREPARRLPARVAGRVLRAERPGPRRGPAGLARDPRRARPHLHGRRAAAPPGSRPTTTTAATAAATRARRWRSSRRSPTTRGRS